MFSHYPCVTAVADGMGSSCLHFSSRHLAQDNFLLATLATVDVSLMQAQWWTKHLKMQAHSWSWCCNFCACILLGVFVHQCLFSLLPFFLYYLLIKDKISQQFQNNCPCNPTEFLRHQHNPQGPLNTILFHCCHDAVLLSSCEAAISRSNAI